MHFVGRGTWLRYGHGGTHAQAVPERCERRRVGVRRTLSDADDRDRPTTAPRAAGVVQWPALRGQDRRTLALDAQRSAALGSGLPAEPARLRAGCFEAIVHDLRALLRL